MTRNYLLAFIGTITLTLHMQTAMGQGLSVNTTGAAADTSAMLDISSSSKGLLMPRMTAAQRDAIHLPANGLEVYITDAAQPGLYINNGTPAAPQWSPVSGNAGTTYTYWSWLYMDSYNQADETAFSYYFFASPDYGLGTPIYSLPASISVWDLLSSNSSYSGSPIPPAIMVAPTDGTITSVVLRFIGNNYEYADIDLVPLIYVAPPGSAVYTTVPAFPDFVFPAMANALNNTTYPVNIPISAGSMIVFGLAAREVVYPQYVGFDNPMYGRVGMSLTIK